MIAAHDVYCARLLIVCHSFFPVFQKLFSQVMDVTQLVDEHDREVAGNVIHIISFTHKCTISIYLLYAYNRCTQCLLYSLTQCLPQVVSCLSQIVFSGYGRDAIGGRARPGGGLERDLRYSPYT